MVKYKEVTSGLSTITTSSTATGGDPSVPFTLLGVEIGEYAFGAFDLESSATSGLTVDNIFPYCYVSKGAPVFDLLPGATLSTLATTCGVASGKISHLIRYYNRLSTQQAHFGLMLYGVQILDWVQTSFAYPQTIALQVAGTMKGELEAIAQLFDSTQWTGSTTDPVFLAPQTNGERILKVPQYANMSVEIQNTSGAALTSFAIATRAHPQSNVWKTESWADYVTTGVGIPEGNIMRLIQWSNNNPNTLAANAKVQMRLNLLKANQIRFSWTPSTAAVTFKGILKG